MVCNINREDVIAVAERIMAPLTEDQINEVMDIYNFEEECDPTGNWDLIVEHCINQIAPPKKVPKPEELTLEDKLHELARLFMYQFNFTPMSLDEYLIEHRDDLNDDERNLGWHISKLIDEL
jgi:hypothetical protein